jgi:hypothetical protein
VGVTGHRTVPKLPHAAEPAIRATVTRLVQQISSELAKTAASDDVRWAFAVEPPELVVVSALAEGADRIVAQVCLDAGATLDVVLPSDQTSYEADFATPASTTEFRQLLNQARSVFQLEGGSGPLDDKRGYEAAGLIMLAHADLLIAIWDEGEPAGIGGTGAIVEQAIAEGTPTFVINPASPDHVALLWTGEMDLPPRNIRTEDLAQVEGFKALPETIRALLAPPAPEAPHEGLTELYRERTGPMRRWPLYSALLAVLAVRPLRRTDFAPSEGDPFSADAWREGFPDVGKPLGDAVCETLLPAITLPDRFAIRYAELYRSAFVFNFLAAAIAVVFAVSGLSTELTPVRAHLDEFARMTVKLCLVASEILILLMIVTVWLRGAGRAWHRRWLDYRRAAESLRYLRVLSLVGARSSIPRPRPAPTPNESGSRHGHRREAGDWVGWYVRAIGRQLPLPALAIDAAYVEAVRVAVTTAELDEQIRYHQATRARMALAAHRLHWVGLFLFAAPIAVGLYFIGGYIAFAASHEQILWAYENRFWVTAATAALPALGGALNAIRVQADFETLAIRSEDTAARLATIRQAMGADPPDFARLSDRIQRAVAVMGAEHSEWRTLFGTRPLSLPA